MYRQQIVQEREQKEREKEVEKAKRKRMRGIRRREVHQILRSTAFKGEPKKRKRNGKRKKAHTVLRRKLNYIRIVQSNLT